MFLHLPGYAGEGDRTKPRSGEMWWWGFLLPHSVASAFPYAASKIDGKSALDGGKGIWSLNNKRQIRKRHMFRLALLTAALLAGPANAADLMDHALNRHPSADQWGVTGNGQTHAMVREAGVPGGWAMQVTVAGPGLNPYDVQAGVPTDRPIHTGDVLLMAFWARAATPPSGSDTIHIVARAQQMTAPYTALASGDLTVSGDWKLYYAQGVSPADYAPGQALANLHLATGAQSIDLGPIFFLDFGPGYDTAKLPQN